MRLAFATVVPLLGLSLGATVALADGPASLAVVRGQSTLVYKMVHKMHTWTGTSKEVEGKATILPDGRAQVVVRAPVASFDSDNTNRDSHMKEATEAGIYPTVELKAIGEGITPPATFPSKETKGFKAQLTFHGVTNRFEFPVELTWKSATELAAHATFRIAIEDYKVERPSLMFVKVDPDLDLTADLTFKR
jgi:polyisoprenoid-binding protein YceI